MGRITSGPRWRFQPRFALPTKAPRRSAGSVIRRSALVEVFKDPQLQELIRTALKQNYDLQQAAERINAARAQLGITRSNEFPLVSLDPNFSGGKNTEAIKSNIFSLAADVTFQLDFFGRLRRATEASRAQLLGTEDAQQTVVLTLVSDVASDYFLLRDLDLQLQVTQDTVKTQQDSVQLTELRLKHGVATRLDVLQARQVLDTANAQIPDLQRQIGAGRGCDQHSSRKLSAGRASRKGSRNRKSARLGLERGICLPNCRPACHRRSSSGGRIFARLNRISSPITPTSAWRRR